MSSSSIPNFVPPVAGTADLATLLRLITDKDFQAQVARYLTDMEEARKAMNETIEAYGKAELLEELITKARIDANQADEVLVNAQEEAARIQDEAEEALTKAWAEVNSEKEKLDNRRNLMNRDEASHREDMRNREEALGDKARDLENKRKDAERTEKQAAELRTKYEEAVKRLKDAGVDI
jgi:chromosome segregation ATPase